MAHLQSVVASEYRAKKSQAKRGSVEQAQPVKGGEEQKSEGEGRAEAQTANVHMGSQER